MYFSTALVTLLPGLASAWVGPAYDGLNTLWQDSFGGAAGSSPSDLWNIAQK